jgi:hypothetical protein
MTGGLPYRGVGGKMDKDAEKYFAERGGTMLLQSRNENRRPGARGGQTNPILDRARDSFDPSDVWTWAMAWEFALADLSLAGWWNVPEDWDYRASIVGADTAAPEYRETLDALYTAGITYSSVAGVIEHAGKVFNRIERQARLAGHAL